MQRTSFAVLGLAPCVGRRSLRGERRILVCGLLLIASLARETTAQALAALSTPRPPRRTPRIGRIAHALAIGMLLLTPVTSGAQLTAPFTRITTGDVVTIPAWYFSSAWGDYDGDGYLDLFVGASVASNRNYLYHNSRDGTFTLIDDANMPKIPSNQHGSAWGDYDNDGHLDLIVTAGQPEITHNVLYHNNGDGTFSGITDGPIYAETDPAGFHGPSWGDYDNDGYVDLFIAGHGFVNRLFHNNRDGTFTRILPSDPNGGALVNEIAHSAGRTWVDYDNDGDIDLFVANLYDLPNFLYRNDGNGRFAKVTDSALSAEVESTIAVCWADYDNDGFADAFLANAQNPSLYHNNRDGTFRRVLDSAVVQEPIPSTAIFSSCAWGDYDNDGFVDLLVTTGCYPPSPDCIPRYSLLYHNAGDGTFTKVTGGSVVNDPTTECSASSWGDYDNDGFLDLLVSQGVFWPDPQTNLLYHNDGNSNGWLNVRLVGSVSNRSAIGAKVRVNAFYRGESRWQVREIIAGDGEGNPTNALNAAFGLADATIVDTLRVEWPSGVVQELHDIAPRQFLQLVEPVPTATPSATPSATPAVTPVAICPETPRSGCRTPVGSRRKLFINARQRLVNWKWRSAGSVDLAQFGDPERTTSIALCLYAGTVATRVMELTAPAGGTCAGKPCWRTIVGRRVRYRDQEATPSGVLRMVLGRSSDTLADILVRAGGANVPLPAMPLAEPVVAQLIRSDGPECWETTYSAADVNDGERFVARNDVDGSGTFSLLRELIARGWHGLALGGAGWISGVRTSSADHGSGLRIDETRPSTTPHELSGHGGLDGAHPRGALALDDPRSGSPVPLKHHCGAGG